jgi:tetratricopeptide (TPR) repeat protein
VNAPFNSNRAWTRERIVRVALVTTLIAYAFLAGLHTVGDFDAGWQMATGRYVVEHHSIPSTDVLSYTARGAAWIYPIFSGVALYLVFAKLGWAGLSWLCALVAAFVVWMITRRRDFATVALAMLALPLIADRATPRADLFTLILLPAFLLVLIGARESAKPVFWAAPLLMIAWVNTHPGFIFGLALLVWYLAAEVVDRQFSRLRKNLPWVLATAAAVLLNPSGVKVLAQWGGIFFSISRPHAANAMQMEAFIGEFSPTRFSLMSLFGAAGLLQAVATAFILLGAAGVVLLLWRRRFAESLLLLGATYGALRYLRFQALAAIVIVIVLGRALDEWLVRDREGEASSTGKLRAISLVAVILLAIIFAAQFVSNRYYVMSSSTSQFGTGLSWWFPERAAEFMKRERIPGQLFHEYNVGGFVALQFSPEYPDYIDGRGGPFGSKMFIEQGLLLREPADSAAWQELAERRGVNALLFSLGRFGGLGSVAAADFCRSQNWRPVYLDEVSIVLLRNVPQNRPWIDRLEVDCAKQPIYDSNMNAPIERRFNKASNAAAVLYVLGRDQEALAALHDAEQIHPYDPNVHLTRGQILEAEGRTHEAEAEFREALRRKQTDTAWMALGGLLASKGKLLEAREAFREAAKLSPHPHSAYKSIGQLSNAMNEPDEALKNFDRAQAESPYKADAELLATEFLALLDQGRAEAWRRKGDPAKAVDFQERAVRRTPMSQKRWVDLAKLYGAAGRPQEEEQAMVRARALSPAK